MSDVLIEELKALAHPLRFRILETLRNGERNVGEIEEATDIRQPALSQQLGVLRKAGLVETRKEAKLVFYRLGIEQLTNLAGLVEGLVPEKGASPTASRTPSPGVANFARISG